MVPGREAWCARCPHGDKSSKKPCWLLGGIPLCIDHYTASAGAPPSTGEPAGTAVQAQAVAPSSRFHDGHFKTQPGLTFKRLDGGTIALTLWDADGNAAEPVLVTAQDWVETFVSTTENAEKLTERDWLLRANEVDRIFSGRS